MNLNKYLLLSLFTSTSALFGAADEPAQATSSTSEQKVIRYVPSLKRQILEKFNFANALSELPESEAQRFDNFFNNNFNSYLLELEQDPDYAHKKKCEIWLHYAARNGITGIINAYICCNQNLDELNKTDSNIQNPFLETALILAIRNGHTEIALQLIQAGANPNLFCKIPALTVACQNKNCTIARALIEAGADTQAIVKHEKTALEYAISNDLIDVIQAIEKEVEENSTAASNSSSKRTCCTIQ